MEVFRITHRKWSGSLVASGMPARWNSAGIHVIYTSGSRALACLENLVHRGSFDRGTPFVTMIINIPGELKIEILRVEELPADWKFSGEAAYSICRPYGDRWYEDSGSSVLKVPSAIIPGESNFLLNPDHPDFDKISIISTEPFIFDQRL